MAVLTEPSPVTAGALRRELSRRFQPSQIEMERADRAGSVTRRGAVVRLVAPMPAKPFRVLEIGGSRKVMQHVMEFARVDVAADGDIETESTPLTVPAGTDLVILDVRLDDDAVHLFAHTAAPLPVRADGESTYGCTEFVFHFDRSTLSSPEPLFGRIGEWLSSPSGDRVCQSGVERLCIEP